MGFRSGLEYRWLNIHEFRLHGAIAVLGSILSFIKSVFHMTRELLNGGLVLK